MTLGFESLEKSDHKGRKGSTEPRTSIEPPGTRDGNFSPEKTERFAATSNEQSWGFLGRIRYTACDLVSDEKSP